MSNQWNPSGKRLPFVEMLKLQLDFRYGSAGIAQRNPKPAAPQVVKTLRRSKHLQKSTAPTNTGFSYGGLTESQKQTVIAGLLRMRRAGHFPGGIWVDVGVLRVRDLLVGPPVYLSWLAAAEAVAQFDRKSAGRAETAAGAADRASGWKTG